MSTMLKNKDCLFVDEWECFYYEREGLDIPEILAVCELCLKIRQGARNLKAAEWNFEQTVKRREAEDRKLET